MALRSVFSFICVLIFLALTNSLVIAEQFTVGTGQNSANLDIEWSDGYSAQFTVGFDSPTVTGIELLNIVETGTGLTADIQDYGFGSFVNGLSFNGHSDDGYGGGANWWHYWIMNNGDADWTSPAFGAADRTVSNGDSDGWVYGSDAAPVPEPVSLVMFGLCGLILSKFRK